MYELINDLKKEESIAEQKIKSEEPFSDAWIDNVKKHQIVSYKLDVLCAADMSAYRRMKPKPEKGIGSDRPLWILDCIEILDEYGKFEISCDELEEIKKQYKFELVERKIGVDRVCKVDW